ncbi:hypothetical protein CHS0354_012083 [Potamilus streckersoni]|uniref:Uncharacterized protein n=1 Tax=Potamilus streckersoni TaxID=2493646 RepID=A0AAE0S9T3_9BIVA|nr:hypothetical protein CHS0354_012083 [Potamilus streckersoni]
MEKSTISSFSQKSKIDDLDLKREIELKKRTFAGGNNIVITIPRELTETLEKRGRTLEQILSATVYEGKVIQKRDKINITASVMSELFEDVKEKIIQHMMELLRQHPEVNMIVMVGGFSESEFIKKAVYKAFPGKTVIIPQDARLAVVKGAVMYGHDNSVIISRSMPFTYGVSVAVPFDDIKHPESKKTLRNGSYKCENNFKVFIRAGESVIPGKTTVQHVCNASTVSSANVEIYCAKSKFPVYVDEPGSTCIGSIQLQLNDTRSSDLHTIRITMSFGSTELSVQAKAEGTNNAVMAKFNFLH